ncbi:mediator subunit 8 [Prunus dulcis]|uniref:Mediator subunit 8 n=1 Tax=Prunus dulcis TaxID=3755 RepID=A0A4Y1RVJ5_PRUDU|nr:mediator subunit 8 [Prunus dulcis]
MSQDSQGIKTIEQWRWSEMQGLELVSDAEPSSDPFKTNPSKPTTPSTTTAAALDRDREWRTRKLKKL